jgi:sialate O-acetylesterase
MRSVSAFLGTLVLGLVVCVGAFAQTPAGQTPKALRLPNIIGDHMVLQAGQPVPIWGWAKPGETVSVRFAGQNLRTKAAADGRWQVSLKALTASRAPADLTVSAGETRVVTDVLVGEVWLASGQSNMEKPIGEQRGQQPTFDAAKEIAAADFPDIRLFKVTRVRSATPKDDVQGQWVKTSPATIDAIKFSAAAYFFGRRLHQELGAPVGLIDSTWGGTRIEPWTPREAFEDMPSLAAFAQWRAASPLKLPEMQLASLYNGMIAPLAPYALKGAIWYQGESNTIEYNDGAIYADKMTALVTGWRKAFGHDLSFYYVQIAPHLYHVVRQGTVVSPEMEPWLWEAQVASMRLPKTGMIVTTDLVDDLMDIHPRNKKDVGERLARWALAKDYGKTGIVVSGPIYRGMTVEGGKAMLSFDYVGGGLAASDDKPLTWFAVAGADGRFYPATAEVVGDRLAVSSPAVPAPAVVHFAWDEGARPNFVNKAGLPASPFRTDNPFLTGK